MHILLHLNMFLPAEQQWNLKALWSVNTAHNLKLESFYKSAFF